MKTEQEFTPKYWIFHNTESDDVYLDTASKSLDTCRNLAHLLYGIVSDDSRYQFSLVEIKLVELK